MVSAQRGKFSVRGFTMVEVLVVISIIALISSIGFATFKGVREKARDAARKQDLNQLVLALEAYYQQNGAYITRNSSGALTQGLCDKDTPIFYSEIKKYMVGENVPVDPQTKAQYCYTSDPALKGQGYRLFAKVESCQDGTNLVPGTNTTNCSAPTYNYSRVSANLKIEPATGAAPSSPTATEAPQRGSTPTPTATTQPASTTQPLATATPAPSGCGRFCASPTPSPTPASTADSDNDGDPDSTDCGPNNANAKHGATEYYASPYINKNNVSSYDYNCDGSATINPSLSLINPGTTISAYSGGSRLGCLAGASASSCGGAASSSTVTCGGSSYICQSSNYYTDASCTVKLNVATATTVTCH